MGKSGDSRLLCIPLLFALCVFSFSFVHAEELLLDTSAGGTEYASNVLGGYLMWNNGGISCDLVPDWTVSRIVVSVKRAPTPIFNFNFGAQIVHGGGFNTYGGSNTTIAQETYSTTSTAFAEYAFTWNVPQNLRALCVAQGNTTPIGIGYIRSSGSGASRTKVISDAVDGVFHNGGGEDPAKDFAFKIYGTLPAPPAPALPDPVIIIPGILGSEQHNGEWVIDPILHTYDDLIATLDVNYYTPEVDLFTFPYDWRKSNVETALLLKQKIDEVKVICACDKVDLVAHSMGGLVARQYIQSDAYDQDVDQLIFLGTPHLGSPKAYLMWEGGEIGPNELLKPLDSIVDELTEILLSHEAYEKNYPTLFAYLRTEPIESVRQLLPASDYIFDSSTLRSYPNNYPANTFLENLNINIATLLNSGVRMYNIIGDVTEQRTIVGISASDPTSYLPMWANGYPDGFFDLMGDHGVIRGGGDNTVPIASASFINSNLESTGFTHSVIPSGAEGNIFKILTGNDASTLVQNLNLPNAKLILIKILSPADLLVIAPDGKKIGKDFSTGREINEIQNAFYTGFTTNTEYITILSPLDGEYKVFNQGTGSGAYTVETNYISDATTTEASYTGSTSPGLITELKLEVDNENPQDIQIIPPDLAPPVITITSPEAKDYLRSSTLSVQVVSDDTESGVLGLETRLDGFVTPNSGSIDLFYRTLGTHYLFASSTDNAGNATTSARTFRIVANATSTLLDIERAYGLGWVTKKISDGLSKKLKACNVKKTTVTNVTKTIVVTGKDGKPTTKKVQEKVTKVEIVFDKNCAKAILKDLDRYRNKGLNEQAYLLLKEDIQWLVNN